MDDLDKKILDIIQSDFPVASQPYAVVGEQIGLDEDEVLARVDRLKADGVIRRMGASFNSRKLGWKSTLCAAKVPPDKLMDFMEEVNRHPGVTHNYLREHDFNIWFTFIGKGWDEVESALAEIEANTGVEVLNLPADKLFKIKVDFAMNDNVDNDTDDNE